MKIELSVAELQVMLALQERSQAEVVRLTAEVARLNERLNNALPTTNMDVAGRNALISALTRVCGYLFLSQKINAIKTIREVTGLGLKEAKDVCEGNYGSEVSY